MIIEASQLLKRPVINTSGNRLGGVDHIVFDAKDGRVYGFQVTLPGVVKRFRSLNFYEVISLNRQSIIIDNKENLVANMRSLDEIFKETGPVINVVAKTESGKKLGRVNDLMLETQSGFIIRFVIRNLFVERIIPRQYVVAITPKAVIFKDIVDQPIFDQVASMNIAPVS